MHPEEKRPNRLQDGKSRARILLKKNAGWLPGFPLGVESDKVRWQAWPWEEPGSSQIFSLDREVLRRMEMTLTKLRHHFPRALPQIVEDVDDWLARVDVLLDALKGTIHEQRSIDVETLLGASLLSPRWVQRFRRLRTIWPDLAPVLDAVACLEFTSRGRCDSSVLDWIDERGTELCRLAKRSQVSLHHQLTFCALRADVHPAALPLLMEYLADGAFCSVPKGNIYTYAEALSEELRKAINAKPFRTPDKPSRSTMGEVWESLLRRLLGSKPKARRDGTKLLASLLPTDLAAGAQSLKAHVENEESRLLKQLRQIQFERLPKHRKRAEKKRLKQDANVVVSDRDAQRVLEHTEFALEHIPTLLDDPSLIQRWIAIVDHLSPEERSLRLGLFSRWEQARLRRRNPDQANRQFDRLVSELCQLFARRGVHQQLLRLWREYVSSSDPYSSEPVIDLLDGDFASGDTCRRWARLVEATVYDRNLTIGSDLLCSFGEFAQATSDIDLASQMVATLARAEDEYFHENRIRATLAIANEKSDLGVVLKRLNNNHEMVEPVALLGRHIQDERLLRIVEGWILGDAKKPLLRLASCTHVVVALGFSPPKVLEIRSAPDWLTSYPSELHESLDGLRRVTPDANSIAAQLLSKEFPDPADLQQQLNTIRQKLDSPESHQDQRSRDRLQKRFENLQIRLNQPPTATPQRIENLAKKIADRVDHEIVERYVHDCFDIAADKMQASYGAREFSDELFVPPKDQLLAGILQLKGVMRELGLRLLLNSQQNPVCDFRSEPANSSFLQRLDDKNIRLEPWLSDSFERRATTAAGESYRLSFTRETLDILLMGFHFDTCLSPNDINFFATIANAVDINKQVLYGKTESGRVVGRCLFALTDSGTLVTYHRYAHDSEDNFGKEVDQFAEQLAGAMGTVLDSRGQVSTLVARTWYDDGAVRIESIYGLQDPKGSVRTILRTEDVSTIEARLLTLFGSEDALKSVLGSLLYLDEFQQRKEIIEPLLDLFAFDVTVPFAERFRLAILARLAGKEETARGIIRSLRVNSLPRRLKRLDCLHCLAFHGIGSYKEVFELLICCNPSIALRTLRSTRPWDTKSDAEETIPTRKKMLARCHQALGRDRPADG